MLAIQSSSFDYRVHEFEWRMNEKFFAVFLSLSLRPALIREESARQDIKKSVQKDLARLFKAFSLFSPSIDTIFMYLDDEYP